MSQIRPCISFRLSSKDTAISFQSEDLGYFTAKLLFLILLTLSNFLFSFFSAHVLMARSLFQSFLKALHMSVR